MDISVIDNLCLYISTLASIYHKNPDTFIGEFHSRRYQLSPAYVTKRKLGLDRDDQRYSIDSNLMLSATTIMPKKIQV